MYILTKQTLYDRFDDFKVLYILYTGIPVVTVTYSAIWEFQNILPFTCNNIRTRLHEKEEELEDTCLRQCQFGFNINVTTKFTYSTLAFFV